MGKVKGKDGEEGGREPIAFQAFILSVARHFPESKRGNC